MIEPAKLLKVLETKSPKRRLFPNPRQILLDEDEKNFALNFPYDAQVVYEIKTHFPLRSWDKDNRRWLIPLAMESIEPLVLLAGAHDFVFRPSAYARAKTYLEDIGFFKQTSAALDTGYEPKRQDGKPFVNREGKPLRPFQKTGVGYGVRSKRCIFGDEQGLGKSVQALASIEVLNAFPCVIVCRESLVYQWEDEVRSWLPHRTVEVVTNSAENIPTYSADVEIIGRSNLKLPASWYEEKNRFIPAILTKKWFKDHYTNLQGRQNKAIVIDEIQDYKNYKSQRGEAVAEFANGRPFGDPVDLRFVLTGTIIENRPAELIQPLRILNRLDDFGGFWIFVNAYCEADQTEYGLNIKGANVENLKALNEKLRSVCYIRREKIQVMPELPAIQPVRIRLPISNEKAYKRAEEGLEDYLIDVDGHETPQTFINELARVEKLRQLAVAGIMEGVEEWLEAFVLTDQKLLIFAHHIDIQNKLFEMSERILKKHGEALYTTRLFAGNAKDQERNKKNFQTDSNARIMIGSMEVGGTGHNLTAASNVALVELPWTPSTIDQILARAYGRLSDAHGIDVYYLNGRNTIHDEIWDLLEEKRKITTAVISGKDPETKVMQQIQREVIARFRQHAKEQRAA